MSAAEYVKVVNTATGEEYEVLRRTAASLVSRGLAEFAKPKPKPKPKKKAAKKASEKATGAEAPADDEKPSETPEDLSGAAPSGGQDADTAENEPHELL